MKKMVILLIALTIVSVGFLSGCTQQNGIDNEDNNKINVVNKSPTAKASADVTSGYSPLTVKFTGLGNDLDGIIVFYQWTFGDGETSTEQNSTHIFQQIGTYTVRLTITDDDGATNNDSIQITVTEKPNKFPTASASADKTEAFKSLTVHFTGSGTDTDGYIVSYEWNFGEGTTSAEQNPTHTFNHDGKNYICGYNVKLTVTDDKGAQAYAYKYITVTGLKMTVTDSYFSYNLNEMRYEIKIETCFDVETIGCYKLYTSKVGEIYETCLTTTNPDEILAGNSATWWVAFRTNERLAGNKLVWERSFGNIEAYI